MCAHAYGAVVGTLTAGRRGREGHIMAALAAAEIIVVWLYCWFNGMQERSNAWACVLRGPCFTEIFGAR